MNHPTKAPRPKFPKARPVPQEVYNVATTVATVEDPHWIVDDRFMNMLLGDLRDTTLSEFKDKLKLIIDNTETFDELETQLDDVLYLNKIANKIVDVQNKEWQEQFDKPVVY